MEEQSRLVHVAHGINANNTRLFTADAPVDQSILQQQLLRPELPHPGPYPTNPHREYQSLQLYAAELVYEAVGTSY